MSEMAKRLMREDMRRLSRDMESELLDRMLWGDEEERQRYQRVYDITVTIRDCEHFERLAELMMDAISALDVTDAVQVVIGEPDLAGWYVVQTRGIIDVKETHQRACDAAQAALEEFWRVESGVVA